MMMMIIMIVKMMSSYPHDAHSIKCDIGCEENIFLILTNRALTHSSFILYMYLPSYLHLLLSSQIHSSAAQCCPCGRVDEVSLWEQGVGGCSEGVPSQVRRGIDIYEWIEG